MKRDSAIILSVSILLAAACVFTVYKALDYRRHVNYFLEKYTNVVTEFSGRQRYAAANARLISEHSSYKRVVFLGDQIIESWNLEKQFPGYEAVGRGISGQRLSGFLLRLRPDVLELKPYAVVIQFSSYNFRPQGSMKEVEDYTADLAELCRYNGIEPILTTVIPVRRKEDTYLSEEFDSYAVSDSVAKFNTWLGEFCRAGGFGLADYYGALADRDGYLPEELSIDNTHLNESGFKRLQETTMTTLMKIEAGQIQLPR